VYRSFDPKNQGPRDKAVARAEKNSAANFCKFFAIDGAKVTLAALIQWQRFQRSPLNRGANVCTFRRLAQKKRTFFFSARPMKTKGKRY
jgi:hypothetical protein